VRSGGNGHILLIGSKLLLFVEVVDRQWCPRIFEKVYHFEEGVLDYIRL
jgi:hypothetical protein